MPSSNHLAHSAMPRVLCTPDNEMVQRLQQQEQHAEVDYCLPCCLASHLLWVLYKPRSSCRAHTHTPAHSSTYLRGICGLLTQHRSTHLESACIRHNSLHPAAVFLMLHLPTTACTRTQAGRRHMPRHDAGLTAHQTTTTTTTCQQGNQLARLLGGHATDCSTCLPSVHFTL